MAPKIVATKRHAAQSAWAKPVVHSSRFAMAAEPEEAGDGWGGDDDLGDLGANDRRRAAEERREQRRRQREEGAGSSPREKKTGLKAAVVRDSE